MTDRDEKIVELLERQAVALEEIARLLAVLVRRPEDEAAIRERNIASGLSL